MKRWVEATRKLHQTKDVSLILDELSYISFNRHQSELLFKVISDRSERGSVIVTTNLPFSQWTELFENTTMVAALVDRLTFKSYGKRKLAANILICSYPV